MKPLIRTLPLLVLLAGCVMQTRPATTPNTPATSAPTVHKTLPMQPPRRVHLQSRQPTPLLLISIDAFRADYIHRGMTPNLSRLAATGVRARALQPSFPSLTFPNHYTLVTGLYPDHHGIVNNNMVDPRIGRFSLSNRAAVGDRRWWDEAEPIWVTAEKHGMKTAPMFWPGSEAKIHGRRPTYWMHYNGHLTPRQRVRHILKWLDLPPRQRPQFLTLYFDRVDHTGHEFGPDSRQVNAAMHRIDAAIGMLIEGLRQRGLYRHMNIIVVSDHGMAPSPARKTIFMDSLIDMKHVKVVSMGELASLIPRRGHDRAIRKTLLRRHRHMRCWDKHHIPARFHYGTNRRVPPIICSPQTGWTISTHGWEAHHTHSRGSHGYDNADPLMRALFIAHGPAFRRGLVVPEIPNVDVYPLAMHLLGLKPRPNDGSFRAVRDMLRDNRLGQHTRR